jgi:hypothetical protein
MNHARLRKKGPESLKGQGYPELKQKHGDDKMAQADFTRIAANIGALNALQSLCTINNKLGIHQQRLSTGKRINSAADDPAGLTIATKMLARSEGLKVALSNIGDAKNMLSVAEAGLGKLTDILVQMRSKAEQAASDTLGSSEWAAIASQLESYAEQIDDVVNETKWNGRNGVETSITRHPHPKTWSGSRPSWTSADTPSGRTPAQGHPPGVPLRFTFRRVGRAVSFSR